MAKHQVGVVRELWRYPVKSMLGERLTEFTAGVGGVEGDRAWALRDAQSGNVLSAKKWPRLFAFRARYRTPAGGGAGEVVIELPDGREFRAGDAAASQAIAGALGHPVHLERARAGEMPKAEIDPATVFGDVPVEQIMPDLTAATMPNFFKLPAGTFFDSAVMHVVTSGTLAHLAKLAGPGAIVDLRRFRPNICVETTPELTGFVEDAWGDATLEVGDGLKLAALKPALRCVMTTHPQDDLPRDLRILRAVAQHHRARTGVFTAIQSPGTVRVGDPVFVAD